MGGFALLARVPVRAWARALAPFLALGIAAAAAGALALGADLAAIAKGPRGDSIGVVSLWSLVRPAPAMLATTSAMGAGDPTVPAASVATGAYLGALPVLLALAGRGRRGWALAVAGVLLALGPRLMLTERIPGPPIPTPWQILAYLPGLGFLQHTARLTTLVALGLAWAAVPAVGRWGRAGWLAPVLVAAEFLGPAGGARLLASAPAPDRGTCAAVASLDPGPVLELPPSFQELSLLAQTCHRRPVAEGINRPMPRSTRVAVEREDWAAVSRLGYRWVVVHGASGASRACAMHSEPLVLDARCLAGNRSPGP
jgi:hypothetical protein